MSDDGSTGARPVELMANLDLAAARQRLDEAAARQTSTVSYVSAGHCLVIGAQDEALRAVAELQAAGIDKATVVSVDPEVSAVDKALTEGGMAVFTVPNLHLGGHLGAFSAVAVSEKVETDLSVSARLERGCFDLVLDLSDESQLAALLPPFGYAHAPSEAHKSSAIEQLAGLVGEFDKPRYFSYDASICAHSLSNLAGCTRCVDVCVTGAISSLGDAVQIDPYLCQGCGSCATLCPSGAMVYAYPKPSDAIARTRTALAEHGATTLVLHGEAAQWTIDRASLPESEFLTLQVEEVSAFGIDYWAAMLVAGASRIVIVVEEASATAQQAGGDPNRAALESQATLLRELLADLSVGPEVLQIVSSADFTTPGSLAEAPPVLREMSPQPAFATHDDKRQTLRMAMDSLTAALANAEQLEASPITRLSAGAPFGQVLVDTQACTLCMACVSTCPAGALLDGQDTPALRLVEANCLQCGLCEKACPETAINLEPRWVRDGVEARRVQTLNEETPFNCITCHKPFATRTLIDTVLGKLDGHWMFTDETARRRLKMCEDCRVKDIFDADKGGLDVHSGAPVKPASRGS